MLPLLMKGCTDKMPVGKMLVDKMPAKIARADKNTSQILVGQTKCNSGNSLQRNKINIMTSTDWECYISTSLKLILIN